MRRPNLTTVRDVACIVIAVVALVVMPVFVVITNRTLDEQQAQQHRSSTLAREAKAQAAQLLQQRSESRQIVCEKDRKIAEAHNRLVMELATAGGTRPVRAQDQAAVDRNTVAVPDCSPAGIADFYAGRAQQDGDATTTTAAPGSVKPARTTTTTRPKPSPPSTGTTSTTYRSEPRCTDAVPLSVPGVSLPCAEDLS